MEADLLTEVMHLIAILLNMSKCTTCYKMLCLFLRIVCQYLVSTVKLVAIFHFQVALKDLTWLIVNVLM